MLKTISGRTVGPALRAMVFVERDSVDGHFIHCWRDNKWRVEAHCHNMQRVHDHIRRRNAIIARLPADEMPF